MPSNSNSNSTDTTSPPQLNLFPLRPSSVADDDNVEYLFNSAADGSATTLTSIFGAVPTSSTSSSMTSEDSNNKTNDDLLARTALRKKERDRGREERWVCYSEVMSTGAASTRPPASEGGSGGGCGGDDEMMMKKRRRRRLELKLDYQEIMNSWGRSLIHIQMESPATVPELMNLDHQQQQSTVMIPLDHPGGWGFSNNGGLWRVPETEKKWNNNNNNNKNRENMKIKEEGIEGGHHLREASMLRYKEKRQSRLFSKRIRYQVRKINAEKRPRLKGRFVKKS